ncbi:hypothetical protein E3N88_21722 [Mikania micrantha]|uniref:SWIRM domain-containing protein n=1 Tax=Mikania micrantha TaxID=192012 RepID=A0A5N6N8E1_9ASTR|nr:hypothetical protein E3N88_21722 [Mikania micrantha]
MATNSGESNGDTTLKPQAQPSKPVPEPTSVPENQKMQPLDSSPNPITPPIPTADSKFPATPITVSSRPPETDADVIHVPSYSRWFSWNNIHECEMRILPEFFDGRSPSKTPKVYKYYRNAIVKKFRDSIKETPPSKENPMPKITFTEARKSIIGDVGSVRKVFDFLESWGLINYFGSPMTKAQLKWEDKESKNVSAASQPNSDPGGANLVGDASVAKKKFCSSCNLPCTIACFTNIKKDTTFCARCYVRAGVNSADFKRVEISEDVKTDWSEKETLHLLEAIMHYGDDWKKVSEHVVGRSEKECVDRFIKLPFGEQYIGPPDSVDPEESFYKGMDQLDTDSNPSKKMRPTPFDDASNPILAQAAFLSTIVGVEVAERAASAGVKALTEVNNETSKEFLESSADDARNHDSLTTNGKSNANSLEGAYLEAKMQLEKEEHELERTISNIVEVQAKDIHDKLVHFEELELQMEREWHQLKQMQNQFTSGKRTVHGVNGAMWMSCNAIAPHNEENTPITCYKVENQRPNSVNYSNQLLDRRRNETICGEYEKQMIRKIVMVLYGIRSLSVGLGCSNFIAMAIEIARETTLDLGPELRLHFEYVVPLPKPYVRLFGAAANAAGRSLVNLIELSASNCHYKAVVELPQVQFCDMMKSNPEAKSSASGLTTRVPVAGTSTAGSTALVPGVDFGSRPVGSTLLNTV